ncbi:hypothetical protein HPB52_016076 [Rhipicephalus sanguineus]|uniref:Uncharacterized protein n=1 Tax=Rhipicephalus sanguineus TaxID=34632 RepID=A0A9D4T0P6_RHISA|nr:hypothetical protein HPB52_016076 [Rhipicephalus sanguineus]
MASRRTPLLVRASHSRHQGDDALRHNSSPALQVAYWSVGTLEGHHGLQETGPTCLHTGAFALPVPPSSTSAPEPAEFLEETGIAAYR